MSDGPFVQAPKQETYLLAVLAKEIQNLPQGLPTNTYIQTRPTLLALIDPTLPLPCPSILAHPGTVLGRLGSENAKCYRAAFGTTPSKPCWNRLGGISGRQAAILEPSWLYPWGAEAVSKKAN